MIKNTYNNTTDKKLTKLIFVMVILFAALYVFFIGVMSVSASKLNFIEAKERTLNSKISELEHEYLSLGKGITLSYATSLGFEEPKEVLFVTEKTLAVN